MADEKLTKFKSGITVLTDEVANSWYGGLFGSDEGSGLDPTDPLVGGHVHDGLHLDGHVQKINLSEHVTGKLPPEFIDGDIAGECCGLLIVTNDGRLVQDDEGNILLKEEQ